jgi:hypothetical protein
VGNMDVTVGSCVICRQGTAERTQKMRSDGKANLSRCSILRQDTVLKGYLSAHAAGDLYIHKSCQAKYVKDPQPQPILEPEGDPLPKTRLRSASDCKFHYNLNCVLCGAYCDSQSGAYRTVLSKSKLHDTITAVCDKRNDPWSFEVVGRLKTSGDLRAADARYHVKCYLYFTNGRQKPGSTTSGSASHATSEMYAVFETVCEWMECSDRELFTLNQLHDKMAEMAENPDSVYGVHYVKKLLMKRYGEHIWFASVCGKKDVICFKDMASHIINEEWYTQRDEDISKESIRIVQAAAKLIKSQIQALVSNTESYPLNSDIGDIRTMNTWLPSLLSTFLQHVISDDVKQTAIGHAIVQASRPRSVISPILFGVGVSLDHTLGSKWLLTTLSRLGFSVSNEEVNRYKQSVVQTDAIELPENYPLCFTQWSADNVDHNVITINGSSTFHGMGIISMSVPCLKLTAGYGEVPIRRLSRVKVQELVKGKGIPLLHYVTPTEPSLKSMRFRPIQFNEGSVATQSMEFNVNLLWKAGWFYSCKSQPRPNWSGFMQAVCVGDNLPPGDFQLLPIIDLNPGDKSCILSTLTFISNQASKLKITEACVTFDQPLWIKAVEILISEKITSVVCRLGGFHMIVSYLGSIGSVMSGSGLAEALQCCYGPNAVQHMMTGKAVSRALRGHFLVDSALNTVLMRSILDEAVASDTSRSGISDTDLDDLKSLYNAVTDGEFDIMTGEAPDCLRKLERALNEVMHSVAAKSRTSKLWLQYMSHIDIVKDFIRAERTGAWDLHLRTVSKMLPLFAAAGHNNYAKCGRMYLQLMQDLPQTHPWLHNKFANGYHAVRRSDRLWGALSTDLLIEQVMMKALKSRGGLTHGRGMTESVRLLWVRSMHKCASIHNAISLLTGAEHNSSDYKHVDLSDARSVRDYEDTLLILGWFEIHNPMQVSDARLMSLATGVFASDDSGVNCDSADEVGKSIMQKMNDAVVIDVTLHKADQVKTLAVLQQKMKKNKTQLAADNNVLFSRLLVIMSRKSPNDLELYFKYELTTVPTAMFSDGGLRKTNKSMLAKQLRKNTSAVLDQPSGPLHHVIDGGSLLHRVVWIPSGTFFDVVQQYIEYIRRHYGYKCTIVFDGYCNGPSVKDSEHMRRAKKSCPDIDVREHNPVYSNQSAFLMNSANKQAFVFMLARHLQMQNYDVQHAVDDADTLIVRVAIELATKQESTVVVVADDTDVLVLLLYHFSNEMSDIYMMSEMARKRTARVALSSVRSIRNDIGERAARQLLVIHAISGCDSTSALYGHGKAGVFRTVINKQDSIVQTCIIESSTSTHAEVVEAGMKLMVTIYGGKSETDSLNSLRYAAYMNQLATCKRQPNPERLPPTNDAAKYHLFRVHIQTVQWKYLMAVDLNATEWGWKEENGMLLPITTDLKAAPDDLLSVISCKCKMSKKRPCSSLVCTCRKHGLNCVASCKHCCGKACDNVLLDAGVPAECETMESHSLEATAFDSLDDIELYEEIVETDMDWD